MEQLKDLIDSVRTNVESGLSALHEAQNNLIHVELEKLKDNENIAGVISKTQLINEQYADQVYDGLKVLNAVVAQKSKELIDKLEQ